MILNKITAAGINWTRSNKTDGHWDSLCVTPTGRIIAGSGSVAGIWYSDDNGINWKSNRTDGFFRSFCVTPTGRIIVCGISTNAVGIWYSDDNGINWTQSNKTDGYFQSSCVTPTGRIIAGSSSVASGRVPAGIWYSDPEYTPVCTKYLDQNGAKEIVTQFKAYCDSLVGGV